MSERKFWNCGDVESLPSTQDELDAIVDENVGEALRDYIADGTIAFVHRKGWVPQIMFLPQIDCVDIHRAVDLADILRSEVESHHVFRGDDEDRQRCINGDESADDPRTDLARKMLQCIADWESEWDAKYPDWRK